MKLAGKKALIAGGNSGIGLATARLSGLPCCAADATARGANPGTASNGIAAEWRVFPKAGD
jgi:NAD(P)-dependent dehydrogenase (short-subunit alcohol dehydrogenase family)